MARILVIDDEQTARAFLREALEREGHEVVEASEGAAGLRCLDESACDLVITDIFMPERDGLEVVVELRRRFPEVQIIAISGGGQMRRLDFLEAAERFGAARALAKPFSPAALITAVRELLGS